MRCSRSLVFGSACLAFVVCVTIPFLGWILSIFVFYGSAALWLVLMFKAYQGEQFKLPIAGDIAEERIRWIRGLRDAEYHTRSANRDFSEFRDPRNLPIASAASSRLESRVQSKLQ